MKRQKANSPENIMWSELENKTYKLKNKKNNKILSFKLGGENVKFQNI